MQQHRVYLDDWSLLEKICLVSAVQRFGENWTSICEFIKPKLQEQRQWDWFTAETCEAQYRQLYSENVKSSNNNENPISQIVQSLKSRCKIEGQPLEEQKNKYLTFKKILEAVAKNEVGIEQLEKYYEKALQAKKDREESRRKYQESLKKRDILKAEYEKADATKSSNKGEAKSDASSPITTSPLLSSLLNNPPPVQYRPTLSTSSFVQTKATQSTSNSTSRQSASLGSVTAARRLSFADNPASPVSESRSSQVKDTRPAKETVTATETPAKSDTQNLENLVSISTNDEYFNDIPPEALLEVIDNLKEGTISLDKIIRDLEGSGDDNIIISKEDVSAVTVNESGVSVKSAKASKKDGEVIEETSSNVDNHKPKMEPSSREEIVEQPVPTDDDQPATDEVSALVDVSTSSSIENIECEPSTSDALDVCTRVTGSEPTAKASNVVDTPIETISAVEVKSEVTPSVDEETEAKEETASKNDVGSNETLLSVNSYETCDIVSEVIEHETTVIEEPEPLASSPKIEVIAEPELVDEAEVREATVENVAKSTNAETPRESEPKSVSAEFVKTGGDGVDVEEVSVSEAVADHANEAAVDRHPAADVEVVTDAAEKPPPKSETPTKKRRMSASLRRESKCEPTEQTRSLEAIPEEPKSMRVEPPSAIDGAFVAAAENASRIAKPPKKTTLEVEPTEVDDVHAKSATLNRSTARRPSRKRKSVSEGDDTPAKITRWLPDVGEQARGENELSDGAVVKQLNVTIKDLCDNIDPSLEAELLKPKDEPLEKETTLDIAETSDKSDKESKNTESRRRATPRRSSARTQSPAVKLEFSSSSSPNPSDDGELARTRRKSILLAYSRLMSHKYSTAFQKPITNKQVPGYENVIHCPMDLHTIKRKIDNRQITTVAEFQRDVLLMLNNAKMFNQINSQVYNMAVEVEKDTLDHLEVTVQALGEGILQKADKVNAEKIRKRQSLENLKKDSKSSKRTKPAGKDDAGPAKKIKLEENEDSENHP